MVPKGLRTMVLAVALVGAWSLAMDASQSATAAEPMQGAGEPVSNYYVLPGPSGGVAAQLYVCPRPTPPLVGHTYVTYQALAPHEFLYQHRRVYYTYNPGAGLTRTRVSWR